MDITPQIEDGYNIIDGYGNGAFKINGVERLGSLIILPKQITNWSVTDFVQINSKSFDFLLNRDDVDLLLIGSGEKHLPLNSSLQQYFAKNNIAVEVMTTGAACRTYNVLLSEGRNVVAAIIAV